MTLLVLHMMPEIWRAAWSLRAKTSCWPSSFSKDLTRRGRKIAVIFDGKKILSLLSILTKMRTGRVENVQRACKIFIFFHLLFRVHNVLTMWCKVTKSFLYLWEMWDPTWIYRIQDLNRLVYNRLFSVSQRDFCPLNHLDLSLLVKWLPSILGTTEDHWRNLHIILSRSKNGIKAPELVKVRNDLSPVRRPFKERLTN